MIREVMLLRADGNYDVDVASEDSALYCMDKSLALESQKAAADINNIVKQFGITGEVPIAQRIPLQIDIDEVLDYQVCQNYILAAQRSFLSLPADVRNSFSNDPAAFVDYAGNPANLPQLRLWGLAPPAVAPAVPESPLDQVVT